MAFVENNFLVANKFALTAKQLDVECNIDAGAILKKVLAIAVNPTVEGYETLIGQVNYSGTIDVKVVFEDEEGGINVASCACPFSSKFENDNILAGHTADIRLKVLDYNTSSVNGSDVKINVSLEESGFVIGNSEIKSVSCDDECVCARDEEIKVVKFISSASEIFTPSSEINIREKVKKLILTESSACIKNVESGSNFVSVSGDVISRVLYVSENDKFESGYVYDSFKEEIEIEGANRDSFVDSSAFVDAKLTQTEIVEDERGSKIIIKPSLHVMVSACGEEEVAIIKDLYSVKNELAITTQSFEMNIPCKAEVVESKIDGSLTLDEESPRVDKILFNGGNAIVLTNVLVSEGEITIEGIARTSVVYLNDESGSLHSVQLDLPFVIKDKTDLLENDILTASGIVSDVDVVVKKGRDLLYDAKVKITINGCRTATDGVITEAVDGEDYSERDYAMEVVFAKAGEESWDIAKNARVKEDQLLAQNENVIFPLQEDASLILFYQKIQ